jgi:uncharacterized protein
MSTERPLLAISRKDLDQGPKLVRAALPAEWLTRHLAPLGEEATAPDVTASADGAVDLRLTPAGDDNFLLQGHVRATLDTRCARCLDPAKVAVDGEITLLLVPKIEASRRARAPKGRRSKDSEGEFEFDGDEADVAHYDGETVILDELVREAILLEVPVAPLCSDACSGIASDPAVAPKLEAARIDPRLAPLVELAEKARAAANKK